MRGPFLTPINGTLWPEFRYSRLSFHSGREAQPVRRNRLRRPRSNARRRSAPIRERQASACLFRQFPLAGLGQNGVSERCMSTQGLMTGKRGLVMGVANDRSIAWGIARALHGAGAELAFTYQGETFRKRVMPLVQPLNPVALIDCDVSQQGSLDNAFAELGRVWDRLDFVVHAVAFSDKEQLKGRYVDTTAGKFRMTMDISC